jgi:uncharacterized DUF497 family protein
MRYHDDFEWDPQKAKADQTKHGVSFEDAKAVLEDDLAELYHLETFDDAHSMAEDRHITTAALPADRSIILLICWTDRYEEDQRVTRIISARHATRRERKQYAQAIEGR